MNICNTDLVVGYKLKIFFFRQFWDTIKRKVIKLAFLVDRKNFWFRFPAMIMFLKYHNPLLKIVCEVRVDSPDFYVDGNHLDLQQFVDVDTLLLLTLYK